MLEGILSISGHGGLFKMVSQAKNSIIVESLVDGKRMPAYATSRISALEDISVFTEEGDVKLEEVFKKIFEKENGEKAINPKKASSGELKDYFESVLPDYDRDRVYVSDIKKILSWYNLLIEKDLIDISEDNDNKTEKEEDNIK
ncbi:MAG: hypothetical protein GXO47_10405 [Chlorobi bacterium]|nr:hypothetical protein [Chlorobiota bacterium]